MMVRRCLIPKTGRDNPELERQLPRLSWLLVSTNTEEEVRMLYKCFLMLDSFGLCGETSAEFRVSLQLDCRT